jgi:hypothetical protein
MGLEAWFVSSIYLIKDIITYSKRRESPSRSWGLKGPAALLVASIAPVIFE